jgi:hypothetical protein
MRLLNRSVVLLVLSLPIASVASAAWTSLAYNPQTGAWGRAQCEATYDEAVDIALNACGGGCQTVAYAEDGYVALALGDTNGWGTGGIHDTLDSTEQASIDRCASKGFTNCHIEVSGSAFNCNY